MIQVITGVFLLVQFLFTGLDLYLLKKKCGLSWSACLQKNKTLIRWILLFWLIFFFVQSLSIFLLPSFAHFKLWIASIHHVSASSTNISQHDWLVGIMFQFWAFAVVSFWDYLSHRFVLHSRWAWALHEYHHIPRQVFNGMPGISVRPYVILGTFLTYFGSLPLIVLPLVYFCSPGAALAFAESLPLLVAALTLVLSINHSYYLRQFSGVHHCLRLLGITSPQEHILHHSRIRKGNFGNFSVIWDRLFRTYLTPDLVNPEAELLGVPYAADFLSTLSFGHRHLSPATAKEAGGKVFFEPFPQ